MAEFAWSGALERASGCAPGEPILEADDLQVRIVDAAQFTLACHLDLAVDAPPREFVQATEAATGHPLPPRPNTRSGGDDEYTIWLDPARWLVVGPISGRFARLEALQQAVAGTSPAAAVSDSSDALVLLEISGAHASALLAMACSLDIDPAVFGPPRTARTAFAGVGALLYRHREGFRVHVDVTLAAHVREWLAQAARLLP